MTFYKFLKTASITDDIDGDFIKDALSDSRFPRTIRSWDELNCYLAFRLRGNEDFLETVLEAARNVWEKYEKGRRPIDATQAMFESVLCP